MVLKVLTVATKTEAEILQNQSVDVTDFDQGIRDLCFDIVETMYASDGAGLAAPQVGQNLNIFVMQTGLEEGRQKHLVIINPHTVIETGDKNTEREGCLSIPGMVGDIERFQTIGCVYWNVEGQRCSTVFHGFNARVYQHEFDHISGVLYPMRASAMYRLKNEHEKN